MSSYYVSSGVTSTGVTLFYNDYLYVSSGGVASDTTVNYGCYLIVSEGGMADVIRVNSRGVLQVYSGGTATNIDWTPCVGWLYLDPGAQATFTNEYSGVYYGANDQLTGSAEVWDSSMIGDDWRVCVMNGGIATNTYVEGGDLEIYSGGVASSISMNWYGRCSVCSGGSANDATVGNRGDMIVGSGGIATSITDNGNLYVREGASADKIKVNGTLYVNSGGTATEIDWTPCVGGLSIEDGAHVTFTSEYSGVYYGEYGQSKSHAPTMENMNLASGSGMFVMADGVANNITIGEYGAEMIIWSGGVANDATGNGGNIRVSSGGIANNAEINANCYFSVSSGGTANNTTVNQYGHLVVSSGGTADKTKVKGWGRLEVYSGGTATNVDWTPCEGYVIVSEGALVTFANEYSGVYYGKDHQLLSSAMTMSGIAMDGSYPEMYVMNGGMADNITVNGWGQLFISSGGTANEAIVSSGYMYVCSGGVANNAAVIPHGSMVLDSGGVASNTTVSYGGNLYVSSGGKLTGRMVFENGVSVSAYEGSIVDFDLSGHSPFGVKLVDNLSAIHGNPLYTLTVSGAETTGSYRLAGNAADFNETITVVNTSGVELGTLAVADGTKEIGGVKYALTLNKKNVLSVMVGELDPNVFTGELTSETKEIKAGSSAFCVDVNISGLLKILKGGTADYTTVNDEADMFVSNGGRAIETEINEYGQMFVSKGGTAKQTTVNEYGSMYVSSGGIASDTTVNYRGCMIISKGGKATETTVSSGGSMIVSKGGKVNSAKICSSGYFGLSGGTINKLSLDQASGCVSSGGGTINDLTLSGGFISFYSGTINRATVDHGDIYCYSGGKLNSATFNGGYLTVSSNCTANKITLENSAYMNIYQSKSKASGVTVKTGGSMYIGSGAVVSNITLLGGISDPSKDQYAGRLSAYGTVKGLTIGSGTSVGLFGSATKVKWTPGNGVVNIWSASVSFTSKYSGVYLGSNGAFVSNTKELVSETLKKGASAYVAKGGVASGLEIASGGSVNVWNGGKALQIQLGIGEDYYSYMQVSSGGIASDVTVFEHGGLQIYSGAKAGDVTICSGGSLYISRGTASGIKIESGGGLGITYGTATDVEWTPFNGELEVWEGAHVTFANELTGVYIGTNGILDTETDKVEGRTIGDVDMGIKFSVKEEMYVMSEGQAKSIIVGNNGIMYVFDGGTADNTTICDGGAMYVYNGGSANGVTVNGGELAVYGGTATDVTINEDGDIYVAGGSASGVTVDSGGSAIVGSGGRLDDATVYSAFYRQGGYINASSGAVLSDITLQYGARLYVSKGAKVTNVTSSYGSLIIAEKGATVKKIKAQEAVSPDSDHSDTDKETGNGWADKKKKTVTDAVLNSEALKFNKEMYSSIVLDTNGPMTYAPYNYKNYVGFTDEIDFKKIYLDGTAMLSFQITATEAAKFTIWEWNGSKMVSKQSTALKEQQESGAKGSIGPSLTEYYVETKGIILEGGKDYYLSVESTNASKGGNAYYYVYLGSSNTKFFGTPNNKDDKWKELTDDYDLGTLSENRDNIVRDWVGYDDAVDYRKFAVGEKASFRFEIQSSEVTKFTIWKYDAKKKKLVSLQKTSIEDNYWGEYRYGTTTGQIQLDAGEYYFSMESPDAKKGGNADYKISVRVGEEYKAALTMPEASDACPLAMPETSDELAMSDALSFGQYDTDVLAGSYLDPASDKLPGESCSGLLASL